MINLIPWRQERKRRRLRRFLGRLMLPLIVLFPIGVGLAVQTYQRQQDLSEHLGNLQQTLSGVDQAIDSLVAVKQQQLEWKPLVQQLTTQQQRQSQPPVLSLLPETKQLSGVYLERLQCEYPQCQVTGIAEPAGRVHDFIELLEQHPQASDFLIDSLRPAQEEGLTLFHRFVISFRLGARQ